MGIGFKRNNHRHKHFVSAPVEEIGYTTQIEPVYTTYDQNYGHMRRRDYSTFNWGMFNWVDDNEVIDETLLVVKSPEGYITPSRTDLSLKLPAKALTPQNIAMTRDLSRFFYSNMIDDKDFIKEEFISESSSLDESLVERCERMKAILEPLWDKFIPGNTPLDKAAFVLNALMETGGGVTSNVLSNCKPKDMLVMTSSIDEDTFRDHTYNELIDKMGLDQARKLEVLRRICMIKHLGAEFKVELEIEEKLASNSRIVTKRMMRDYSQLPMVDMYQKMMPTYKSKVLTKDLIINAHIEKTEHKQKIIIILDYSGSMDETEKQTWVMSIMIDRLKYVIKEEAEIFFSLFTSNTSTLQFTHIYDKKTAFAFWSKFKTSPDGGGTDVGGMIQYIGDQIQAGKLHNLKIDLRKEKPEVLVINDGQDSIHTTGFTYKTNALTLIQNNPELRDLCIKNGGKYIHIDYKGRISEN